MEWEVPQQMKNIQVERRRRRKGDKEERTGVSER